jgi:4-diphosphocytidyl-2-C-methyl-D-erythritol kinase
LIVFPNCKINLGLNITGKRADGYHNLQTIFYPLPFYDVLEIISSSNTGPPVQLFLSGLFIQGKPEDNLCVKAYRLLKKDFPQLPSVKIYLHKTIPPGAGLGGGSSNGAFALMLLNDKYNLQLQQERLLEYALLLGSDCPFFIMHKPCFAQQRGEDMEPLDLDLSGYKLILINPGIHINTGWAFTRIKFSPAINIKQIVSMHMEEWKQQLFNSFEPPVFAQFPQIEAIKKDLYASGALYASMSGTGSSVYGIFKQDFHIDQRSFPQGSLIKELFL